MKTGIKRIVPAKLNPYIKPIYTICQSRLLYLYRDLGNKIKYGYKAPIFGERIWVDSKDCKKVIMGQTLKKYFNGKDTKTLSGSVINDPSLFEQSVSIKEIKQLVFCIDHWCKGIAWENTGIYRLLLQHIKERGEADNCSNIKEIIERYKNLDLIFNEVKKEGRLKTMREINPSNFREIGGPVIHIGPKGEPIFGGVGCHRFAIAIILGIKFPAQIGVVYRKSISYLPNFRKKS